MRLRGRKILAMSLSIFLFFSLNLSVRADISISAPSVILMEASTGQIIYEANSSERRCPASITKIMTLLIAFEQMEAGKIRLDDKVLTSHFASSMGGSQVFLVEGEVQTLDTMLKCIAVASGNDASVAVAEHIAGSEEAFVDMMNERAAQLGMADTHFVDCCGLTDSDDHYTSAKDVAIMSRELITKHPEVYRYTQIWMEDITHETRQGSSSFTLSSTNKLLKQYQWTTGLKTGSTSKAKYCISATARKDGIDLIAVIMGAGDVKTRFQDAKTLLSYGFSVCNLYIDENRDKLQDIPVKKGVLESAPVTYQGEFRYLDIQGQALDQIQKMIDVPDSITAPIEKNAQVGEAKYLLNNDVIGIVPILCAEEIPAAKYADYLRKVCNIFLL